MGCNLSCRIRFKIIDPPGEWRIASRYLRVIALPSPPSPRTLPPSSSSPREGRRKIKTRKSPAPDEKFDRRERAGELRRQGRKVGARQAGARIAPLRRMDFSQLQQPGIRPETHRSTSRAADCHGDSLSLSLSVIVRHRARVPSTS